MGRHVLLALLILSLVVLDVSDASFVWEIRKLVALDPKDSKTDGSQPTSENKSNPNPDGETNKGKGGVPSTNSLAPRPQSSPKVDNGKESIDDKKKSNDTPPSATAPTPPVPKKDDVGGDKGSEEQKGKLEDKRFSHSTTTETCEGLNNCTDEGGMVACISIIDPKYLVVLLQNRGDGIIKVRLQTDLENNLGAVDVDKNKIEKVNITRSSSESRLTLNAGKRDCVLPLVTHIPEGSLILRFPSYDKILTPVNGAYFLIFTVLVFGGTWACCMFRKKRHDEVPYQELEMALPESVSATNVESAEGWDQGWDDDWDDNVAVKSPAAHHTLSISANGLTSRSSNKEGWENNWDD